MNIPARWTSLEMILYDMLFISYLVPEERLQPLLPPGITPAWVMERQAIIGVWLFHVLEAKAARVPSPRLAYNQANVYTFVRDPITQEKAMFLLRASVTAGAVARVARWLKIPVDVIRLEITPERDKRLRYRRYQAQGEWTGTLQVEVDEVAPRLNDLPPFANAQAAAVYLTDMLIGLYAPGTDIRRMEAWHPRLQPRVAQARMVQLPILTHLGVITEDEMARPHCVLLAPRGHYLLHLPPHRVTHTAPLRPEGHENVTTEPS